MGWNSDWTSEAACRGSDPDTLFVQGAAQNRAKAVCLGCVVRTECLADALDNRVEFGVWGGMTERERRALLRRRPNVTSWRNLLQTAQEEYERTETDDGAAAAVGEAAVPAPVGQPLESAATVGYVTIPEPRVSRRAARR
jgi:WhiB family redox-sensing transcriptional regulator